ncbi:MAG: ribbon-helix-helix protein, CopG family [Candidatus Subteraquimicrobiales bacterium]|nr:ribbon-helix-helix protein, CopG family [Candidatus Subteraquimicrobiales bacterium]
MTTQMIIRMDAELKEKLSKIARREGKATSEVIRELVTSYVKEHDIEAYIDSLWGRVGKKLKSKGMKLEKIDKVIAEARGGK